MRAWAFARVHIDGQAEHEAHRVAFGCDSEQARRVGLESLALDGFDPGRKPAIGIGCRDPDGLGAQIEAHKCAAFRPVRGRLDQR